MVLSHIVWVTNKSLSVNKTYFSPTKFHFFPRSVELGPTASNANGAFTTDPSILCQAHAIPSNSSYSANPTANKDSKNPASNQSRKYL